MEHTLETHTASKGAANKLCLGIVYVPVRSPR